MVHRVIYLWLHQSKGSVLWIYGWRTGRVYVERAPSPVLAGHFFSRMDRTFFGSRF